MLKFRPYALAPLVLVLALMLVGCNLSGSPQQQEPLSGTQTVESALLPSRTPASTSGLPATAQIPTFFPTSITFPTQPVIVVIPTSVPPVVLPPTTFPINIVILSPIPGNVVAGNVQVLGSASHPQFLQYQLEYGPDPNPGNLWYPATAPQFAPVLNNILGIWNTTIIPDGRYQLRLRVYLRDGRIEQTVVGGINVQNRVNTPVPSPTPEIPRPIAAFTQDVTSGQVPLTVRFTNQSSGSITAVQWTFGDGVSSTEINPVHTYSTPGLYTVTLTVSGPGGSSNVSRQIAANSPAAPVAAFVTDVQGGFAPLTVQFINQSTGNITAFQWNFSDGTLSSERDPRRVFSVPGTYNIILTVTGPGGSSSVVRQISVSSTTPPTLTPSLAPTLVAPTATVLPVDTIAPSQTPVPIIVTETPIPAPTETETPIPAPTETETPIPAPTETETPIPTPTETETPIPTPTETETPIPTPTETETPIPTPTETETPIPTPTETETPIPTPTETPVPFNPADMLPVYPDLNDGRYNQIVQTGLGAGNRPNVFAYAGGIPVADPNVLRPFAPGMPYNTAQYGNLAALIDSVNSVDIEGATSFSRASVAAGFDWIVTDLLDPARANPGVCQPGEAPINCEIRMTQPSVIFIGVGMNDALRGLDLFTFENALRQTIVTASTQGVLPIVLTMPRGSVDAGTAASYSEAIVRAASEQGAPILNIWALLNGASAMGNFTLSVSPSGAGDLSDGATSTYGANAINFALLQVFSNVQGQFFP